MEERGDAVQEVSGWWTGLGAVFLCSVAALQRRPGAAAAPASAARLAALAVAGVRPSGPTVEELGAVQLRLLGFDGRVAGPARPLSSLWSPKGAVVFVVRRPG